MWGQNCQEPGFSGTGDLWFGNELASQALPPPLTFSKTKRQVFHGSLEHRSRSARGVASGGARKTCHHVSPENVPGECRATQVGPRGCGSTGGLPGHCGCQTGDVPIRYTHPLSLSSTTASSLHTTAATLWCLSSLGGSSGLGLLTSTASSALRTGGYCVKSNAARANNLER